jgi:hypothetical protein
VEHAEAVGVAVTIDTVDVLDNEVDSVPVIVADDELDDELDCVNFEDELPLEDAVEVLLCPGEGVLVAVTLEVVEVDSVAVTLLVVLWVGEAERDFQEGDDDELKLPENVVESVGVALDVDD